MYLPCLGDQRLCVTEQKQTRVSRLVKFRLCELHIQVKDQLEAPYINMNDGSHYYLWTHQEYFLERSTWIKMDKSRPGSMHVTTPLLAWASKTEELKWDQAWNGNCNIHSSYAGVTVSWSAGASIGHNIQAETFAAWMQDIGCSGNCLWCLR